MSTKWNTIKSWNAGRFNVSLAWAWEDYPDLSWDETGEVLAKCESGEFGVYTYRVLVTCDGREVGSDYLGNSIYADPTEFYREHIGVKHAGENVGCYFTDMMHSAISEARKTLCNPPKVRCAA